MVANGDCASVDDAASMIAQSGADGVMIGRAAMGQPWIVGDVAHYLKTGKHGPRRLRRSAKIAREHFETWLVHGRVAGLRHARKHLAAYVEWVGVRERFARRAWSRNVDAAGRQTERIILMGHLEREAA